MTLTKQGLLSNQLVKSRDAPRLIPGFILKRSKVPNLQLHKNHLKLSKHLKPTSPHAGATQKLSLDTGHVLELSLHVVVSEN